LKDNEMRDRMLANMFALDGRVAIVTGALGRLGREYVRTLAGAGARVGAIDIAGDRAAFAELVANGHRVHVELADLAQKPDTDRAVAAIVAELGAPSILVNNAGMGSSPATRTAPLRITRKRRGTR
jgi:NAD(P)-dependent dehydrogenase (short-subunit alcohol dehydrogenase family)